MSKSTLAVILFIWIIFFNGGYYTMMKTSIPSPFGAYVVGVLIGTGLFYASILIYKYNRNSKIKL